MIDIPLAVRTHGWNQVQHKEWSPEYHKREKYYTQNLGRFLLQPYDSSVARRVTRDYARIAAVMAPDGSCSAAD